MKKFKVTMSDGTEKIVLAGNKEQAKKLSESKENGVYTEKEIKKLINEFKNEKVGDQKISHVIYIRDYDSALIAIKDETGKIGLMNDAMEIIAPCIFDSIYCEGDSDLNFFIGEEEYVFEPDDIKKLKKNLISLFQD